MKGKDLTQENIMKGVGPARVAQDCDTRTLLK